MVETSCLDEAEIEPNERSDSTWSRSWSFLPSKRNTLFFAAPLKTKTFQTREAFLQKKEEL
nr:hypothetical protein [Marseillevirus cajuinensis]